MNNSSSALNSTEKSLFSPDTINLNNNVEFSELDISEIYTNETISFTLQAHEATLLRQRKHSNKENAKEDTKEVTTDATSLLDCSTMEVEEIGSGAEDDDEEEEDEEEESVVNVDDQSTLLEQSTLQAADAKEAVVEESARQEMTHSEMTGVPSHEGEFFMHDLIELGRRLWPSTMEKQHYTKGCLWSPDGTCLLLPVHLDGMHVIELPTDLYTTDAMSDSSMRAVSSLDSAVHVKEGGTVYDCAWYPFMNSGAPETCCWLASRQHEPIHMWDAFDGKLRCSYRGYDDVDEVESAISVTFSNDGQKVIGGYKKSIKVFDTNVPGRDCVSMPVKQACSCFALTTDNDDTITAGSWNGYINHYDLRVPKLGSLFTLGGHNGGITWLRYAHGGDHWKLFSGARKDNKILQWDMRDYTKPVREFQRQVATNQRIYFDLSPQQEWLISGDTGGFLHVWDLCDDTMGPMTVPLHDDCCNGVNFHPTRPILSTSSGQYHFVDNTQDEEEEVETQAQADVAKERIVDYENTLLLLWFGNNEPAEN